MHEPAGSADRVTAAPVTGTAPVSVGHGHRQRYQSGVRSGHRSRQEAALDGPVFITDRGRPAHILLSIKEYQRLTSKVRTLADALANWNWGDFDFDLPRMDFVSRPAEFD